MLWILYELFKILLLLVFPFILLIRGAVYFHIQHAMSPWTSILGGIVMCAIALFLYFSFFYGRFTGKLGRMDALRRRAIIAFLIVVLYAMQGILFLSTDNMKSDDIKSEMSSVHPILRLSVSTLTYLDPELIITDANRQPEDYRKMGLKQKSHSLHYKQSNGYAHALDLRTKNRSIWRNAATKWYFNLMGFNTLRHVGTADHLHISLKSQDRPGAI